MPATKTPPLKLPRGEHYLLFDRIASGGMASVHLGLLRGALGFSRVVAIKRLHPTFARDERRMAMMVDEARIASLVRHVNVVPTLDVLVWAGEIFVVMEYVRGAPLSSLIHHVRDNGALIPVPVLVNVLSGALRGLHAAHTATTFEGDPLGIVHRDISPQNVLVGVGGIARLIDFGVAQAKGSSDATKDGEFKGKLAYAAPEQLGGERVTCRTDVFAMGVMLWEMLVGERLFAAESDVDTYRNVAMKDVPHPVALFDADTPDGERMRRHRTREEVAVLGAVAMRALSRDPSARFESAEAMERAIRAVPGTTPSEVAVLVQQCAAARLAVEHSVVSSFAQRAEELDVTPAATEEPPPPRLALEVPGAPPAPAAAPVEHPRAPEPSLTTVLPDRGAQPIAFKSLALVLVAAFLGALVGQWLRG